MKFALIFSAALCTITSFAGLAEHYGSSSSTMAVGSQANNNINDPANLYYAPALNGFARDTVYSFNQSTLHFAIKEINNVVVLNQSNSENTNPVFGDSKVDYQDSYLFSAHLGTSLIKALGIRFGLSFYTPVNKLIHQNTGDSFEPNYVFYNKRHERTQFEFNLSKSWKNLSLSLGGFLGMQASGQTKVITQETGDDYPNSSGQVEVQVKPSFGLIASLAYKNSYLTFREEMQSKVIVDSFVQNPIGSASGFVFDLEMKSMMYFDPLTVIAGHHHHFNKLSLLASLSYERWSHFKSPKLELSTESSGFNSSADFEKLDPKDIIIPRIAAVYRLNDLSSYSVGYSFRESPLQNDLNGSGNTIDLDKHILAGGYQRRFKIAQADFRFTVAGQIHLLKSRKVVKKAGIENGAAGSKVGAPGYDAGGQVYALSFGLSWVNL